MLSPACWVCSYNHGRSLRLDEELAFVSGRMTAAIALILAAEMGLVDALRRFGFLAALGHAPFVAAFWAVRLVHMAAKIFRAVKPWACALEAPAKA